MYQMPDIAILVIAKSDPSNFCCVLVPVTSRGHIPHRHRATLNGTSLGARAMHGFGAEVFIEEVQCYDDMMIYSTGVSFLA